MELVALLCDEAVDQVRPFGQVDSTRFEHHECRHALLLEHGVACVLVETIDQFDEALLDKFEVL
jgi:hypothetical protein